MPAMPDVESIKAVLRQVIDPEVGVNIVDLGLVYGIDITPDQISIRLTMTSPACPMGDLIMGDIDAALDAALPPEIGVVVNMVWDPPWTPEMMNKDARGHFGWKGHDDR